MTVTVTKIVQSTAAILQILNAVNVAQLPIKVQVWVTGGIAIIQGIQGILAHYYTPQGEKI